ncbi:Ap1g1, partial [Symbiodinium necroappetens]
MPSEVVQLVLPLILKLGILGEEAVGLKGASMTHLYKHKGPRNKCESYRAIMLLPTLTKVIHKAFRPSLYEHVIASAPPILLGGKRGASAVFGNHVVRSFCRWCSRERRPACVLFADVASAYYQSVRDLTARRTVVSEGSVRSSALPLDEPGCDGLAERLAGDSAFARGNASSWLESLAAELHRGSWFSLRGDHVPVVTRRGSRPGSALADLMYSAGIESIVAMRDSLRAATPSAGSVPSLPWDSRRDLSERSPPREFVPLTDVIWADDLATCLTLSSSHMASLQTAIEASVLDESFAAHGYTLSYGAAKTAAMVALQGQGARSARRDLFRGKGVLSVVREHAEPASLPLVATYRHLGVLISANNSFLPELRARSSSAWSAFRQGRLKAYRCRRIAVARRGALLSTMVLPRLLFGAGAWPSLRKGECSFYHRTVFALYRQTLCVPHGEDQHISGATACALLQLPDPATLLRVERLRYLRQLVQSAPDALWALIRQDNAYLEEMRSALSWLFARLRATVDLGDPLAHWESWGDVMRCAPGRFRGAFSSLIVMSPLHLLGMCDMSRWGTFCPAGPVLAEGVHPQAPPVQPPGDCTPFGEPEIDFAATGHPALLDALLALEAADEDRVWEVVQDFIAPLQHLRATVEAWGSHPSAQAFVPDL